MGGLGDATEPGIPTAIVVRQFFGKASYVDHTYNPVAEQWMMKGLCGQVDPEVFFPPKGGSGKQARRICNVCPVMEACREYAINRPQIGGIWGGLTENQRAVVRKEREWRGRKPQTENGGMRKKRNG